MNAPGRLVSEEEFGDIIVKTGANGEVTRLRDVARIELGARPTMRCARCSTTSRRSAIPIFQAPGSNAIQISDNVREDHGGAQEEHAGGRGLQDRLRSDAVRPLPRSRRVIHTLLEAMALVVLVVILFLQTWRASIIPLLAVPVSLDRHLCGDVRGRLLDQCAEPVRAGARDRHRGRRRHRRGGERRA